MADSMDGGPVHLYGYICLYATFSSIFVFFCLRSTILLPGGMQRPLGEERRRAALPKSEEAVAGRPKG
jgi:hypothetical protein